MDVGRVVLSSGACGGVVARIYRLTACRCNDSRLLASRVRMCLSRGRHGWGQLHPFHLRISTASLSHHLLSASNMHFLGGSFLPQQVEHHPDLYPATASSTLNKGSAVLATMATFRDHQPQSKCPPGMISVGCGVDGDPFAWDLHPPKSIGCYWLLHDSTL